MEKISEKLVYKDRIENVKAAGKAFKEEGALSAARTLVGGFGANNRKLVKAGQ